MKRLLLCAVLLCSCQTSQDYHAGSVAEAKAYAAKAVQAGVVHKGGEAALLAQQSAGKPQEGKWSSAKMDRHIAQYVEEHPQIAMINLAASAGKISEADRVFYTTVAETQEKRAAEAELAAKQDAAAQLNQSSMLNTQGSYYRYNSALMQNTPSAYPGSGAGISGMGYGGFGY